MTANSAAGPAPSASPRVALYRAGTREWRVLVYATSMVFAVAWTIALGKDVHWDALNYHLYLGFSAFNDRFTQDFFAAGPASYLNPYAYAPLYWMHDSGWSAIAIAVTLAAWHALVLWLTFELALVTGIANRFADHVPKFAALAVVLAGSNVVLLHEIGSTMSDVSTAVLVLASWLGIARAVRTGSVLPMLMAGALAGVAAGLKLSNAVFAVAAVFAIGSFPGGLLAKIRCAALFGAACATGFACVALPWSLQLWREFENPFFPFLNHVFRSGDFTAEPLRYERFIPSDLLAFLWRPFEMLSAHSHVHTEPNAPDARYVALIVVVVGWMATWRRARHRTGTSDPDRARDAEAASTRAIASLLVGFAVAWCLWLAISGNSRYFLPMACIASVLLAVLLQRIHAVWQRGTVMTIFVIVAVQSVQFAVGTDWRRDGGEWGGPWLRVDVPGSLRNEPYLYLSAGFLSGSAFLPSLNSQSGMINIGGFNYIAPRHPGGARAQRLIERNRDRLRILVPLPSGVVDRATLPGPPEALGIYVRRFGLRVDGSDCEFLRVQGNLRGERRQDKGSTWKAFIACRLLPAPAERLAYEQTVDAIDPVFDRVEDVCPTLFHPRRPATQESRYVARTYHMGSEIQLYVEDGRVKYFYPLRGGDPIDIGAVETWQQGPQPIDCSVRTKPALQDVAR